MSTATYEKRWIGPVKMWARIGTGLCYPINDETSEAICQLNWAYEKLSQPCVTFDNGRTSHECANELIEEFDDVLIDHTHLTLGVIA